MAGKLRAAVISFNGAREFVDADLFASNLVNTVKWNNPDVIFMSLQEVAPVAHSFLGGSFIQPYLARYKKAIDTAGQLWFPEEDSHYVLLEVRHVGMTALLCFVRDDQVEKIRWIEIAAVGLGLYEMGNKGCVGVRLGVSHGDSTVPLTFLAAHLAAHEHCLPRRNEDWLRIVEDTHFLRTKAKSSMEVETASIASEAQPLLSEEQGNNESKNPGIYDSGAYVLLAGDLNYRTGDSRPTEEDSHFPRPKSLSDVESFEYLLKRDQLTRERKAGVVLHGFQEATIQFPPTYKYSHAAQLAAAKSREEVYRGDQDSVFAKWRWPSWCDRILLLNEVAPESNIEQLNPKYASLPLLPSSDHQPVSLYCELDLDIGRDAQRQPPSTVSRIAKPSIQLKSDALSRRAAARRKEVAAGIIVYCSWTWEGNALVLATLLGAWGGWALIRAMLVE